MKKISVFLVLILISLSTYAQSDVPQTSKNKVSFGLKLGLNLSHMNFNRGFPKPSAKITSSWNPGFLVGGLLEVPMFNKVFLQPEYSILLAGGKVDSWATQYRLTYLSIPLLLKYKVLSRIAFVAGPQVELLIKGKKTEDGNSFNITHDTEERNVGVVAGFEIRLNNYFYFNTRYIHGINNVGLGQRSDIVEFKYETVQVSMDVKF